jgi:ribosomal protein S12 methylthiotransferase
MDIGVISLGCDKNRVDTEKMLARLVSAGNRIVGNEKDADVIVINTCAFIDAAKSEAIAEILSAVQAKKASQGRKKIVVTGCLAQRYLDQLQKEFPEVDAFLGVGAYDNIENTVEKIANGQKQAHRECKDLFYKDRVLTTPYHYAYLKIAEGCDNRCTYCAIPAIRGKYRSERLGDLLSEAKQLSDDGVKELILVAQDVTRYGTDWDGMPHLIQLVRELEKFDFEWIRLLYLEPEMVDDELIAFIANEPKVVKYADVPLQHIDSRILKLMNRHTTEESSLAVVKKLKAAGICVRSTFICGFPTEDEQAFLKLKGFIEQGLVDYAGFFAYSREEGTAADRMKGHLSESVKEARAEELRIVQNGVMERNHKRFIGKTLRVLYEGIDYDKQTFRGRAYFQTPDIDGTVYFDSDTEVDIGNFYDVTITDAQGADLFGRILQ